MSDLRHDDSIIGMCIVSFDGRVLELFNERTADAQRLIVGMLHVKVDEPDRKGRRDVKFTCNSGFRSGGGFRLVADETQWAAVEPFVREVEAAL